MLGYVGEIVVYGGGVGARDVPCPDSGHEDGQAEEGVDEYVKRVTNEGHFCEFNDGYASDSVAHASNHREHRRAEQNQRHGDVREQHVLGHVKGEELAAEGVQRGDEGEEQEQQAG